MKILDFEFVQDKGQAREWSLERCHFDDINLITGKNAVGKTRLINVINSLSRLLCEKKELDWNSGNFYIKYSDGDEIIEYQLHYEDFNVIKEELRIDDEVLLTRKKSGQGVILAEDIPDKIRFKIPTNQIAAYVKRDSIQHKFLEKLFNWGKNVLCYRFGSRLGQDSALARNENYKNLEINIKDTERVLEIFDDGIKNYNSQFINSIKSDMKEIGYSIKKIAIRPAKGLRFNKPLEATPFQLILNENDIKGDIFQHEISQGMFRALSLIIQLNYTLLSKIPACILIDDIGEGLDYERSTSMINLIIDKTKNSNIQLIMTTNDRFVMNKVPLKYWMIFHRNGNQVRNYTYAKSKKIFEEFELTGLSNFDLFTSAYYLNN